MTTRVLRDALCGAFIVLAACASRPHPAVDSQAVNGPIAKTANGGVIIYGSASDMAPGHDTIVDAQPLTSAPDAMPSPPTTDGSIEVYNLDKSASADGPLTPLSGGMESTNPPPSPLTAGGYGVAYGGDPSIEIFPLDGPAASMGNGTLSQNGAGNWNEGVSTNRVYFANGAAGIDSDEDIIRKIAAAAGSGTLVRVEGHASRHTVLKNRKESHIVNLSVAMQRAVNVSKALIRHGVPAKNIKTTAWGDTRPPAATDGKGEDAAARRVEIYLQKP